MHDPKGDLLRSLLLFFLFLETHRGKDGYAFLSLSDVAIQFVPGTDSRNPCGIRPLGENHEDIAHAVLVKRCHGSKESGEGLTFSGLELDSKVCKGLCT